MEQWEEGPLLGTKVRSSVPKGEAMLSPQPIKTCSLGKRLEMQLGGREVGTKMSTTQVSTASSGPGWEVWGGGGI